MSNGNFTCAQCGVTEEKGWSDEEALKEAHENNMNFASHNDPVVAVVCTRCYGEIMTWARIIGLHRDKGKGE